MTFSTKAKIFQIIIQFLVVYIVLYIISPSFGNFILSCVLVALVPFLIIRQIFIATVYKNSINIVNKAFRINKNSIHNDLCTVIFTENEKLTVMDNASSNLHSKRMFTLTNDKINVNKAWNRLCRIFDDYTSLDSLEAFFSYETDVRTIILESKKTNQPHSQVNITVQKPIVDMKSVQPDSFGKDFGKKKPVVDEYIDLGSLDTPAQVTERNQQEPEFTSIEGIMNKYDKKIDVNNAEAAELSVLPGINIISAKKIIEWRNKNGSFKSEEDFYKIANIKEHFIPKIKTMIYIGSPKKMKDDDDDNYGGRIVDF